MFLRGIENDIRPVAIDEVLVPIAIAIGEAGMPIAIGGEVPIMNDCGGANCYIISYNTV